MILGDEHATEVLGSRLARVLTGALVVYLCGDLGTGKTTLVRAILRAMGYRGPVKSPTYTLLEIYRCAGQRVYHFDLYRLADPEELEFMGARDYFGEHALCLVEWPERGRGSLPAADVTVTLEYWKSGRRCHLQAVEEGGRAALAGFQPPAGVAVRRNGG
ncbi:MAG: tRNA (adenosine(37)-N6)-threonylcarbamoyltransferase complex ATPase subunit type 1 TsaE [Gammaproteobacteria bacterium]|nr:tRNA (adenosine(37)-N6)-threonylcarbamoyltransferase complex ATPase subunit type 1 TsaE [Gammaproteobacteria bacterium]